MPGKRNTIRHIPELRRGFEDMERHVRNVATMSISEKAKIKQIRDHWYQIFSRRLSVASATVLLKEHTPKRASKGGARLDAAPLDHTTRPGIYLAPGQVPDVDGGLPLSGQTGGAFGSYLAYVNSGFFNPNIAQSYDPVKGQPAWPAPSTSMGSNLVQGGARKKKGTRRRVRGGSYAGAVLDQAFQRPISSSAPPSIMQDMQDMWHGGKVGASPDSVQRHPVYQLQD